MVSSLICTRIKFNELMQKYTMHVFRIIVKMQEAKRPACLSWRGTERLRDRAASPSSPAFLAGHDQEKLHTNQPICRQGLMPAAGCLLNEEST